MDSFVPLSLRACSATAPSFCQLHRSIDSTNHYDEHTSSCLYTQIVHKPIHVFFLSFPILKNSAFITFNKSSKIVSESVISCTISWSPLSQKQISIFFLPLAPFFFFEVCLSRDRSSYTILVSLSFKCFILSLVLTNAFNTCSCFVTCFDNASNFHLSFVNLFYSLWESI